MLGKVFHLPFAALLSIAKLFRAALLLLMGSRTGIARYSAEWGIAQLHLWQMKEQRGVLQLLGRRAKHTEKISRNLGHRSDSIAISRNMEPLS